MSDFFRVGTVILRRSHVAAVSKGGDAPAAIRIRFIDGTEVKYTYTSPKSRDERINEFERELVNEGKMLTLVPGVEDEDTPEKTKVQTLADNMMTILDLLDGMNQRIGRMESYVHDI